MNSRVFIVIVNVAMMILTNHLYTIGMGNFTVNNDGGF
jgi:hypothetical protein